MDLAALLASLTPGQLAGLAELGAHVAELGDTYEPGPAIKNPGPTLVQQLAGERSLIDGGAAGCTEKHVAMGGIKLTCARTEHDGTREHAAYGPDKVLISWL